MREATTIGPAAPNSTEPSEILRRRHGDGGYLPIVLRQTPGVGTRECGAGFQCDVDGPQRPRIIQLCLSHDGCLEQKRGAGGRAADR